MRKVLGMAVLALYSALLLALSPTLATAITIRNFEFNVDGELPTSDPDVSLITFGAGVPESSVFSVSDGLLHQRGLTAEANYKYFWQDFAGVLDPSESLVMEARLTILAIQGSSEIQPGVFFQTFDPLHRYSVFFDASGVILFASSIITVPVNVFEEHTYRIESPGGSNAFDFYIDGQLKAQGFAAPTVELGISFGDGGNLTRGGDGLTAGDADWDYIRVSQSVPLGIFPVSEPAALPLFCLGLIGVCLARRRTNRTNANVRAYPIANSDC